MFLWCEVPEGLDAAEIARACLRDKIILAPGNVFSLSHTANRFLRFNVAQSADSRIFRSLERVLRGSHQPNA
jgi:DNA-binding transcriptional MocR family regulator